MNLFLFYFLEIGDSVILAKVYRCGCTLAIHFVFYIFPM